MVKYFALQFGTWLNALGKESKMNCDKCNGKADSSPDNEKGLSRPVFDVKPVRLPYTRQVENHPQSTAVQKTHHHMNVAEETIHF